MFFLTLHIRTRFFQKILYLKKIKRKTTEKVIGLNKVHFDSVFFLKFKKMYYGALKCFYYSIIVLHTNSVNFTDVA